MHVKMSIMEKKDSHPQSSVNIPLRDLTVLVSHAHDAPPVQRQGGVVGGEGGVNVSVVEAMQRDSGEKYSVLFSLLKKIKVERERKEKDGQLGGGGGQTCTG